MARGRGAVWALVGGLALVALIWAGVAARRAPDRGGPAALPAVGAPAPSGTFTTVAGTAMTVSALRGRPALLWFVATWRSSCQAGSQVLARNIDRFSAAGVRVVEIELYDDLGGQGPDIAAFGRQFAGPAFTNPDWIWGTASQAMSFRYDPNGYLDIYYLLDARGVIRYVNGSPANTLGDLLQQVAHIGA